MLQFALFKSCFYDTILQGNQSQGGLPSVLWREHPPNERKEGD